MGSCRSGKEKHEEEANKKRTGLSWIESPGVVHYSAVGDDSHEMLEC